MRKSKVVEYAYRTYLKNLKRAYKSDVKRGIYGRRRELKRLIKFYEKRYQRYKARGLKKADLLFAKRYFEKVSKSPRRKYYLSVVNRLMKKLYPPPKPPVAVPPAPPPPKPPIKKLYFLVREQERELVNFVYYEFVYAFAGGYDYLVQILFEVLTELYKNKKIRDGDIYYLILHYLCFDVLDVDAGIDKIARDEIYDIVFNEDEFGFYSFEKRYIDKINFVNSIGFEFSSGHIFEQADRLVYFVSIKPDVYGCYDILPFAFTISIHREK